MIKVAEMCKRHTSELVHGAGYKPDEPWRALVVAANVALFQAITADDKIMKRLGHDLMKIEGVGCLACRLGDKFKSIVEVAKSKRLREIKELGDSGEVGIVIWTRSTSRRLAQKIIREVMRPKASRRRKK